MVGAGKGALGALAASALLVYGAVAASAHEYRPAVGGQPDPARPRVALMAGVGDVYGWAGGSAEYFFLDSRMSAALGVGRASASDDEEEDGPSTTAFAAAVRRYLLDGKHRPFLEASYSLVALEWKRSASGALVDVDRYYGPGLAVGYRYTARGGFTVSTGVGGGWAVGADRFLSALQFGLGYTWRR